MRLVYKVGPRPSISGYKAADWEGNMIWEGRLRIVETGKTGAILKFEVRPSLRSLSFFEHELMAHFYLPWFRTPTRESPSPTRPTPRPGRPSSPCWTALATSS